MEEVGEELGEEAGVEEVGDCHCCEKRTIKGIAGPPHYRTFGDQPSHVSTISPSSSPFLSSPLLPPPSSSPPSSLSLILLLDPIDLTKEDDALQKALALSLQEMQQQPDSGGISLEDQELSRCV